MQSTEFDVTARYKSIFQKFYSQLLVYATGIVGESEAEDVITEVFAELWRKRNETDMGDKIQAFLYRAVYTRALNVLKHRNVTASYISVVENIQEQRSRFYKSPPQWDLENQDIRNALTEAIGELPEKCREVFRMRYIEGHKNSEIAEQLGISVKTVEAHMYKALKSLRERLKSLKKSLL